MNKTRALRISAPLALAVLAFAACGGGSGGETALPQLSAATGANYQGSCETLQQAAGTGLSNTVLTSATTVAAGVVSGATTAEHCRVVGKMNERVSPIDGNTYAIGFEMRLPRTWNGRFFYQANGGTDGNIGTASGGVGGAGATSTALSMGFAVISSDAGHSGGTPFFGLDPQARLDYGYNAVAQLTPMAKSLIKNVYGKAPDRSYLGGCSNGGRHAMVAAARYGHLYDGILAGDPGFNLPKAAVAQLWGVQQYAKVSTANLNVTVSNAGGTTTVSLPDVSTSFTTKEMDVVAGAVLARCDALDGATDGLVSDPAACQSRFDVQRDVATCTGARDGSCLTTAQKGVLASIFAGAKNAAGQSIYTTFPFDAGINSGGWRVWKFANSTGLARDPGATAFIFTSPPLTNTSTFVGLPYALNFSIETDAPRIFSTNATYSESPMSFMTPPNPTNLSTLKNRGAKLMVYHGVSDGVFSFDDTRAWYEGVMAANGGDASNFARLYAVPGMGHCSGGPATDKFDMLQPLVEWVEQGRAPDTVVAAARGGANAEVPASWSATRSRPLCPWPKVARYKGSGDTESAVNFSCQ